MLSWLALCNRESNVALGIIVYIIWYEKIDLETFINKRFIFSNNLLKKLFPTARGYGAGIPFVEIIEKPLCKSKYFSVEKVNSLVWVLSNIPLLP